MSHANQRHNVLLLPPRVRCAIVADVCRPSSVHCSSRGHISKTKQDRRIVAMENYYAVGISDSVTAFISSQMPPLWRYYGFKNKICAYILFYGFLFDVVNRADRRLTTVLATVVINGPWRSESVVYNRQFVAVLSEGAKETKEKRRTKNDGIFMH